MEKVLCRFDEMFNYLAAQDSAGMMACVLVFCRNEQAVLPMGCELSPHSNWWLNLQLPSTACGLLSGKSVSSEPTTVTYSFLSPTEGCTAGKGLEALRDSWQRVQIPSFSQTGTPFALSTLRCTWGMFLPLDIWLPLGTDNEVFLEGAEIFLGQGCKEH